MTSALVLGGDGFCGWPTALHLSANGIRVAIVDNLSRRKIDEELGASSLTPIASIEDRLAAWQKVTSQAIAFYLIDIAEDYPALLQVLMEFKPDVVVHFAEQRSAPYSMKSPQHKRYTVDNNVSGTHNLLCAAVELAMDTHIVHLGTVGVYGYNGTDLAMPEGYLDIIIREPNGREHQRSILYPSEPGSVYHMTKSIDQLLFQYYAENDRLRITDLHQGVVWGTQTDETRRADALINRFDYDGDYGTVLNRFLVQGVVGHALTVHGTGGQTRGFINIQDTVRCVRLAVENPPERGGRVKIFNQVAETKRVRDLANMVAQITGASVAYVDNPRNEAAENELEVTNVSFPALGLHSVLLDQSLFNETMEIVERFKSRFDPAIVPARSLWTASHKPGVVPET